MSEFIENADGDKARLFAAIADDIAAQGYSVQPRALPQSLCHALLNHVQAMPPAAFKKAGIGRDGQHQQNALVRKDEICWISGSSEAEQAWLDWAATLQDYLNRQLFLGLFSFESHFAHYGPGDFYKKHSDAFKGQANRVLSVVVYLNQAWQAGDGGELLLYHHESAETCLKIVPDFATLVVFLSEDFPHEVVAAQRDRFSIAAWFRTRSN